jgi:cell division protein FtsW
MNHQVHTPLERVFGGFGADALLRKKGRRTMAPYDASLLWSVLILLALGLVMVYSASMATAEAGAFTGYRPWYFLVRQAVFIGVALLCAVVAFQLPMATWQKLAPWLFLICLFLLVLVLVPSIGKTVNGARRWLPLYFTNVQPSELMKLAVVFYAANYAVRKAEFLPAHQPMAKTLVRGFLPLFVVMVMVGGLLLLQPDFGALVIVLMIGFGVLFIGGLDGRIRR